MIGRDWSSGVPKRSQCRRDLGTWRSACNSQSGICAALVLAWVALSSTAAGAAPLPDRNSKKERVVVRKKGLFGDIVVVDSERFRSMRFGSAEADDQTVIDRKDPRQTPVEYVRFAASGLGYASKPARALVIGVGGGSFPRLLTQLEPGIKIDAVEIDPAVVDVARSHFDLNSIENLTVFVEDGAAFVKHQKTKWDLILVDAYGSDDMPAALISDAFFRDVRALVSDRGAVVLNLAVSVESERKVLSRFQPLFSACVMARTPEDKNLIVIGTPREVDPKRARASDVARRTRAKLPFVVDRWRRCGPPVDDEDW